MFHNTAAAVINLFSTVPGFLLNKNPQRGFRSINSAGRSSALGYIFLGNLHSSDILNQLIQRQLSEHTEDAS
jgi:hypothetical protein